MVDSVGLADRRAISAAERVRYREVTRPFALCQRVWPCETIRAHGYEPIPTLDPMAPEELLKFTTCNCIVETAATEGAAAKEWRKVHLSMWQLQGHHMQELHR